MSSWIDRAKKTLQEIITNVVTSTDGLKVRVSFVGYRDHCDSERFSIQPFSDDITQVRDFIAKTQATGGGDIPEDVVGGLRKCLDLDWTAGSSRQVFLICDAPCHGTEYFTGYDSYPNGSPEGHKLEPLMREFRDKGIDFTVIKLDSNCDKMIAAMQANHTGVQVTDLESAVRTKSAEEVTKMFVDSASFILRAQVGGNAAVKGGSSNGKRAAVKTGPLLWDPNKLAEKDIFSCISYLKVEKIEGNTITVQNQLGGKWIISRDILEKEMWSADHFDKEVKCTMTDLSEIIEGCGDTVFTIQFKKKADPKDIEAKLANVKATSLKKADEVKKLSQQLIEGETVTLTAHLSESENHLGRSLVIDLNAKSPSNFKQVDHRTIDWIIFRNVKYSLGKKAPGTEELPLKYDRATPKWTSSKLAVGNWFSSSTYYKVKEITDKETCQVVNPESGSHALQMSIDIMKYEMHSGTVFSKEEHLARTKIIELLASAKDCVFTVTFHKKIDADFVKTKLQSAPSDTWNNTKKLQVLSKELLMGPECIMTCRLSKTEHKLGRSKVIDLNAPAGMNYRQIDHRTVTSLILKNVKYIVKN